MVKTYRITKVVDQAKAEGLFTEFLNAGTGGHLLTLARDQFNTDKRVYFSYVAGNEVLGFVATKSFRQTVSAGSGRDQTNSVTAGPQVKAKRNCSPIIPNISVVGLGGERAEETTESGYAHLLSLNSVTYLLPLSEMQYWARWTACLIQYVS